MCIFFYIYMIHKDDAQTLYTKDAKFLGIIKNLPPHYYDDRSWTRTSPIGQRDLLPVIFIFSTI